jgi:hypothetical protein
MILKWIFWNDLWGFIDSQVIFTLFLLQGLYRVEMDRKKNVNRWGFGRKIPDLSHLFACRSWWKLYILADITATFEHVTTLIEFFHVHTVLHLDIFKVFYSPTDAQVNCLIIILKCTSKLTLKQLRHVSVQSPHHQGAHYSSYSC